MFSIYNIDIRVIALSEITNLHIGNLVHTYLREMSYFQNEVFVILVIIVCKYVELMDIVTCS